jgi:hypothetical protein
VKHVLYSPFHLRKEKIMKGGVSVSKTKSAFENNRSQSAAHNMTLIPLQ